MSGRVHVGIDGCAGGWVLATLPEEGEAHVRVERVTDLLALFGQIDAGHVLTAGIDIPIGLPEAGSRRCDVEARRAIGPRRSSVFPAPLRSLLGATTYEEAAERSRAMNGKGISRQAFNILAKIDEVDRLMTPALQHRVKEVHPELCFTVLGGAPMRHHKATPEGRSERLGALRSVISNTDELASLRLPGTKPDDLLDAVVVAWSAARWSGGPHLQLGGELDSRGLRMEILA